MSILTLKTSRTLVNVPPSVPDSPDIDDPLIPAFVPETVFLTFPLFALELSPMRTYSFSSTEMMASVCHLYMRQLGMLKEKRDTHILFVQILVPTFYGLSELIHGFHEILLTGLDSLDPVSQVA
jgi:hypothetical protein